MPSGNITHRRICPNAKMRCFRGVCNDCNKHPYVLVSHIEADAASRGYGRDFIAGRVNDFMHAQVLREV